MLIKFPISYFLKALAHCGRSTTLASSLLDAEFLTAEPSSARFHYWFIGTGFPDSPTNERT